MAKERMITRTITDTVVVALCMNTETCEVSRETYHCGNVGTDEKTLEKGLKEIFDTDNFKIVKIEEIKEDTRLYGMSETDFMENAVELDPETRKPLQETRA